MAYPKNFDPALLVGIDGSDPFPEQEPWYSWCNGGNGAIPDDFALYLWWHLADAMDSLVMKGGREWPEKYKCREDGAHSERQIQIFRSEFNERFELVDEIIRANWFPCQPYAFEGMVAAATKGEYNEVEMQAVYGIRCLDEGISAMLNNDAKTSSQCFCYAFKAFHLSWEYREVAGKPIREIAKAGARARHAKDPKQAAFREIRETHWPKWCHKKRYKAPFAREMIKQFPILESPKVIEDRCRHWEKEAATKV